MEKRESVSGYIKYGYIDSMVNSQMVSQSVMSNHATSWIILKL